MRDDIDFHSLPIHHETVYVFFSKKLNRVAWVSADSTSEAIKRLVREDEKVWSFSRSLLGTMSAHALEMAQMLDEKDTSYGARPRANSK